MSRSKYESELQSKFETIRTDGSRLVATFISISIYESLRERSGIREIVAPTTSIHRNNIYVGLCFPILRPYDYKIRHFGVPVF